MYAVELQTKRILSTKFHEMVIIQENQLISTFETFSRNHCRAYGTSYTCTALETGKNIPIIIITIMVCIHGYGPIPTNTQCSPQSKHS